MENTLILLFSVVVKLFYKCYLNRLLNLCEALELTNECGYLLLVEKDYIRYWNLREYCTFVASAFKFIEGSAIIWVRFWVNQESKGSVLTSNCPRPVRTQAGAL